MPNGPQHRVHGGTHGSSSALGNGLRRSGEEKTTPCEKSRLAKALLSVIKSKPRRNTRDQSPSQHGATESPETCVEGDARGARGEGCSLGKGVQRHRADTGGGKLKPLGASPGLGAVSGVRPGGQTPPSKPAGRWYFWAWQNHGI